MVIAEGNTRAMNTPSPGWRVPVQVQSTDSAAKTSAKFDYRLLCVLGCTIHLAILGIEYFEFRTVASYGSYLPSEQQLPFVSLCSKMNSKSNVEKCQSRVIDASVIMQRCNTRNFTSKQLESVECSRAFTTTESCHKQLYHCYDVKPKKVVKYMFLDAIAVFSGRQVLYNFFLSEYLAQQRGIMLIVYFKERPDEEFSSRMKLQNNEESKNRSLELGYQMLESSLLPAPYDTDCVDGSACFDQQGRRHPWCKKDLCENNVTITLLREMKSTMNGVFVQIKCYASPAMRTSYSPLKGPESFILEICGLLSLWVNFSIFAVFTSTLDSCLKAHPSLRDDREPQMASEMVRAKHKKSLSNRIHSHQHGRAHSTAASHGDKRGPSSTTKFLFTLVLICLFSREVYIISADYFTYKTRMHVKMEANKLALYPSVSHCIDIYEFFNLTLPSQYYVTLDQEFTNFFRGFNYTLKQIFEATPRPQTAISKCRVRVSVDGPLVTFDDCKNYFDTRKFYYGKFICYNFRPKVPFFRPIDFEQDVKTIYSVIPSDELVPKYHHQTIVSFGIPIESRMLAGYIWRTKPNQLVRLRYQIYTSTRLPPPYDTQCSETGNSNECEIACIDLDKIGLVPYSHVIEEPIDLPLINYYHLKNESVSDYVEAALERCTSVCKVRCHSSLIRTVPISHVSNHSHQISLNSPQNPELFFNAYAVYTIYEFVYQLACSASFWVGLSLPNMIEFAVKWRPGTRTVPTPVEQAVDSGAFTLTHNAKQTHLTTIFNEPWILLTRLMSLLKGNSKRLLILIPVAIGFIIHSASVVSSYLEYPTSMTTRMVHSGNYTDVRSTVCVTIEQLDLQGDYTLHNIWSKSPRPEEFLYECGYRGSLIPQLSHLPSVLRRRIMPHINSSEICNSLLTVKKFSTLGLICYQVMPGEGTTDTEYRAQYQIGDSKVYGYFTMTPEISSYNLTIALSQGPPVTSLLMPTMPHRNYISSPCVYYFLQYVQYRLTSPPHPYGVGVYDSLKQMLCMRSCYGDGMRKRNIFSPYATAFDQSFSPHETALQSSQQESIRLMSDCHTKCDNLKLLQQETIVYYDTYSYYPHNIASSDRRNGSISLWFTAGNNLVTEITFYPDLRLVDLVVFLGSLFGVWAGLCVLQLIDFIN